MDVMNKVNDLGMALYTIDRKKDVGPLADADRIKGAVSTYYDAAAAAAWRGEMWNWGMHDDVVRREISEIIPAHGEQGSDGLSEQLYFFTIRKVPITFNDYSARRVLEVGCGLGDGLYFISRILNSGSLVGLDLSPTAIQSATARFGRNNIQFLRGDAERLPFHDREFDVVINVESSHTYPDLGKFIAEVGRVLKPGGYFSHVDLFTRERYQSMALLKQSPCGLQWLSEQDVSEKVKASIAKRMAPDSFLKKLHRSRQASAQTPQPQREMHELYLEVMYGVSFLTGGDHAATADSSPLPIDRYCHSLARKL